MERPANNPTVAITEVVSAALETPLEELPPLSRVVNLDALNRLVSSTQGTRPSGVTVTFEYAGLNVVVQSRGMVYATPIDDDAETVQGRDFET